ncbi:hypothetical protein PTSG_06434 [Salpingoeca rosetta]|uniref:Smr domain-containing protein n=1 Tax=Salpingoeca rosetta (strain ATCC 50818 / BSB-021) TaxID=946362 RepID=F2UFT0_SALR5|nr:uncharacterized protein PTSG_06434 [Salpingoeca rosetta]EGD75358.1 hypothetical protein PTSG_06434 [Salpingoeca rosetta]|eukprot:XP_004991815.1 hypothetical protein PTSG_06434 [Salpingoeca rosetta]
MTHTSTRTSINTSTCTRRPITFPSTRVQGHVRQVSTMPRQHRVFISLRFSEASQALKKALERRSVPTIADAVIGAIDECELVVIMGTHTYGEKTDSPFGSSEELEFIINEKKPFFLVKMCDRFKHAKPRFWLPPTISYHLWKPQGAERFDPPRSLIDAILAKLKDVSGGVDVPQAPQPAQQQQEQQQQQQEQQQQQQQQRWATIDPQAMEEENNDRDNMGSSSARGRDPSVPQVHENATSSNGEDANDDDDDDDLLDADGTQQIVVRPQDGRLGMGIVGESTARGGGVYISNVSNADAAAQGLEVGMRIMTIDGEDVRDCSHGGVVQKLRSKTGDGVVLGVIGGDDGFARLLRHCSGTTSRAHNSNDVLTSQGVADSSDNGEGKLEEDGTRQIVVRRQNGQFGLRLVSKTIACGDGVYINGIINADAAAQGLVSGMRIMTIDGEDVRDFSRKDVVRKLRSKTGDGVVLGVIGGDDGYSRLREVASQSNAQHQGPETHLHHVSQTKRTESVKAPSPLYSSPACDTRTASSSSLPASRSGAFKPLNYEPLNTQVWAPTTLTTTGAGVPPLDEVAQQQQQAAQLFFEDNGPMMQRLAQPFPGATEEKRFHAHSYKHAAAHYLRLPDDLAPLSSTDASTATATMSISGKQPYSTLKASRVEAAAPARSSRSSRMPQMASARSRSKRRQEADSRAHGCPLMCSIEGSGGGRSGRSGSPPHSALDRNNSGNSPSGCRYSSSSKTRDVPDRRRHATHKAAAGVRSSQTSSNRQGDDAECYNGDDDDGYLAAAEDNTDDALAPASVDTSATFMKQQLIQMGFEDNQDLDQAIQFSNGSILEALDYLEAIRASAMAKCANVPPSSNSEKIEGDSNSRSTSTRSINRTTGKASAVRVSRARSSRSSSMSQRTKFDPKEFPGVRSRYSGQAATYRHRAREADADAAHAPMMHNSRGLRRNTYDLHGLSVTAAIREVRGLIDDANARRRSGLTAPRFFYFVTGSGQHSADGRSRIKAVLKNYCTGSGLRYEDVDGATIRIFTRPRR